MDALSFDDRALGLYLGLGDLQHRDVCHGYANACVCPECLDRAQQPLDAPPAVRQPWELAA